jgi:hypothetical protein
MPWRVSPAASDAPHGGKDHARRPVGDVGQTVKGASLIWPATISTGSAAL